MFLERCIFPVRANFFLRVFLGVVVTAMMGAWAMFPPIFRDPKREFLIDMRLSASSMSFAKVHL